MNAIETRGLTWKADSFRLDRLELAVPEGSIYGFLGPNGSGKTTTIRLLLGMAKPAGGSIRLLDRPVPGAMPEILARTGYVPERPHLYDHLTVAETEAFHAAHWASWDAAWAGELRVAFRLRPDATVRKMSKGEVGKLMILLALARRPELLVLDEPTDGLDPVVRREVLEAMLQYVSESGATVFISSHLVHELERFCDTVGVIDDGRLVTQLPMRAFKEDIKRLQVVDPPMAAVAETASGTRDARAADAAPGAEGREAGVGATAGGPAPVFPFTVLARRPDPVGIGESWVVRGWQPEMAAAVERAGGRVRDVVDLDLEEAFVELLSTARTGASGEKEVA
jgi:ABC-2 type transport system ATP-binding protein